MADAATGRLHRGLPSRDALAGSAALFVCDLPRTDAAALVATARALNILVNVEDETALCDFHMPAIVRRGDLVLSISTGGKSPRPGEPPPAAARAPVRCKLGGSHRGLGAPPPTLARTAVTARARWPGSRGGCSTGPAGCPPSIAMPPDARRI
ncbi:MAG: NAD(P)-dependent oxidoreductase [Pseudomonadota bacterium]